MNGGRLMRKHSSDASQLLMLRLVLLAVLALLVSACGTTMEKPKRAPALVGGKQSCSQALAGPEGGAKAAEGAASVQCLPKGVIEIAENYPVDPEIKLEFAKALEMLNAEKYPEAIRLLKGVTGKTSKFSAPYINLGIVYMRTGENELAEEALKKALEISPQHPVANNEMGMLYRKTGRYADARKLYEGLLEVYPDFLPIRKNLGVLCDIYLQDLNCAQDQYLEYLKGVPDDEKVKIWLADVKSRM